MASGDSSSSLREATRRAARRTGFVLAGLGILGLAWLACLPPCAPLRTPEVVAFAVLPWSRIAAPPGAGGEWRVPLRRVPEAPEIVILSRSCGCVDARLEDDALVLRVRDDKRPHELVLMLGFRLRDGRAAVRRVAVVPTYPPPPSHGLIAELHASGRCSQVVGWSHLPTREPPRYDGDPRLRLRTRPAAGGGHEVLLYGLTHSSPAFEPGHVLADGARVPVRMYRR